MNKKIFIVPVLTLFLLAGCKETPISQYRFNISCNNCLVNFEDSLSINVNANEIVKFTLTSNEGYLLPLDIKVTSGNQIFVRNLDYTYTTSEDRLSGEIAIKATKAVDINIEADEQGYLYIGENKINKSGDYSKYDLVSSGDNEDGKILYDYQTNTLTLTNARLFAEKIGLNEYTVPFEEDETTFTSLISWTGGGTLNVVIQDLVYFSGSKTADNDCAFICPTDGDKINIYGPGVATFFELDEGVVINTRGRTSINNVYFQSYDLGEFGICSRDLDILNSDLYLISDNLVDQSVGVYANNCLIKNSYVLTKGFVIGSKATQLVLVDSFLESNCFELGLFADWLYTYGHIENGKYTTKIYAYGETFGISTLDAMELSNTELRATCDGGYALITVDSEIIAQNCDIYAHANIGQAVHAHYLELTNCNLEAKCDDGIGILTSIRGAQPTSREYEPVLVFDNCNVTASGSDVAIYGFGHAEFYNCDNVPKYLEKELSEELQLYMWALVEDGVTEIKYEGGFDPETGAPNFVPTNALTEIELKATK